MNGMRSDQKNDEQMPVTRDALITELETFIATTDEQDFIPRFLELLKAERCFHRDHFNPGHITASSLLLNTDNNYILMNYHKSLNKWLNFGGHCDGEEDAFSVGIRETMEESGLTAFKPVTASIIDIDIHTIPANPVKAEPAHEHFDIRYLMRMTAEQRPVISSESLDMQWMSFSDALDVASNNQSLTRLIKKAQSLVSSGE